MPTRKQKEILDFIQQFTTEHGYSPTQNEIMLHFGFKSLGHVQHFIRALKKEGLWNKPTSNTPPQHTTAPHIWPLPLLGKVAAGSPLDYQLSNEVFDVPLGLFPQLAAKSTLIGGESPEFFVLQASGRSMIDAHILDGDYLIIKKQSQANNGQIVVCSINQAATIKRFFKKKTGIELHPENPEYDIIRVNPDEQFQIEGLLVGVISARS